MVAHPGAGVTDDDVVVVAGTTTMMTGHKRTLICNQRAQIEMNNYCWVIDLKQSKFVACHHRPTHHYYQPHHLGLISLITYITYIYIPYFPYKYSKFGFEHHSKIRVNKMYVEQWFPTVFVL